MRLERECGHDAEVAATSADRPEQIGVLVGVRLDKAAVREDDVDGEHVVDGESPPARQVADAAAEGEAGDARRREDAGRHGETECAGRVVEVAEGAARPDLDGLRLRIDAHPLLEGEIDHEAVIDRAEPGTVVAAAANGDLQALFACEVHGGDHVGGVEAARDEARMLVDHPVVELASLVVAGIVGPMTSPRRLDASSSTCVTALIVITLLSLDPTMAYHFAGPDSRAVSSELFGAATRGRRPQGGLADARRAGRARGG